MYVCYKSNFHIKIDKKKNVEIKCLKKIEYYFTKEQ